MKNERDKLLADLAKINELLEPPLFTVCLHNDDFTPMDFVVLTLEKIFFMDKQKATQVMMEVHLSGKAICGIYTRDVADTKVSQVVEFARVHEHPLICTLEST